MSDISINPGRLRHNVIILHETPVSGVSGTSLQWTQYVAAKAAIDAGKRPTDTAGQGQTTTLLYLTVTIRYQPGITTAMRVQSLNGTYEISAIENVLERNVI